MRHDYDSEHPGGAVAAVLAVGIAFGVIILAGIGVVGFILAGWHW